MAGERSSKPARRAEAKKEQQDADKKMNHPDSFVVVLAYDATKGDTSEEFAEMVESFKALFSLREGHRVYATFDETAKNILNLVEKPADE